MIESANENNMPGSAWLRRMADAEDECVSPSVGGLACDLGMSQSNGREPAQVFGRLVEFARRDRGLSLEGLSKVADIDLAELVAIEIGQVRRPSLHAVQRLAEVLNLPAARLGELAGLTPPPESLHHAAVRFAARSESNAKLSAPERHAFEEFVKVLAEL